MGYKLEISTHVDKKDKILSVQFVWMNVINFPH